LASLVVAFALGGCGGSAPAHTTTAKDSALDRAETTHEYQSAPAPRQHAKAAAVDALTAVRTFATAYINWTAKTVTADMRAVAAASVGQARSAMALAAANAGGDYELRRGGIANQGKVEAIAPLAGAADEYVVVTRERTTSSATAAYQGLRPAWHLTLATVTKLSGGGWVLSGWRPQS
jgi:hypothetical protein